MSLVSVSAVLSLLLIQPGEALCAPVKVELRESPTKCTSGEKGCRDSSCPLGTADTVCSLFVVSTMGTISSVLQIHFNKHPKQLYSLNWRDTCLRDFLVRGVFEGEPWGPELCYACAGIPYGADSSPSCSTRDAAPY